MMIDGMIALCIAASLLAGVFIGVLLARYTARRNAIPECAAPASERIFSSEYKHQHVASFLLATLVPSPAATVSLRVLYAAYIAWSSELPPRARLSNAELANHLRAIIDDTGLTWVANDNDVTIRGVALAPLGLA